ncbi:SoxR reducing system RseC family protein [Desulfobacula sp.]|uniref:SoxR reducing system RseC family protein n=1 Tax=Desulfobacula sp. TaxID=2593537 RepID=UPI0025BA4E8A|nr:SoxR reducing system RseC family protein [Desulfobacula sp.]MBC2703760.1 SoxR reducing system RseC family protein [Desulfobacula sp.]
MITENGIVTKANQSVAWIKTTRSGACESCSSQKSCGTANNQKEITVDVKNTLNVEKGDHVVIGLETKPMLFLTFFLYVFPIILLIIGAVIGNSLAPSLQMDPSFASMISGFLFFGFSFYIIRKKNNSLSKKEAYKPFLVRKKPQIIPADCTTP